MDAAGMAEFGRDHDQIDWVDFITPNGDRRRVTIDANDDGFEVFVLGASSDKRTTNRMSTAIQFAHDFVREAKGKVIR